MPSIMDFISPVFPADQDSQSLSLTIGNGATHLPLALSYLSEDEDSITKINTAHNTVHYSFNFKTAPPLLGRESNTTSSKPSFPTFPSFMHCAK